MKTVTIKPGTPWEPTAKERGQKTLNLLIAVAISFVLLYSTGLNGKLGWVAAFFFSLGGKRISIR